MEKWSINNVDGSKGTIQGPWKDQGTAQKMADARPTTGGFVNSSTMKRHRVELLEQSKFKSSPDGIVLHRTVTDNADQTFRAFESKGFGTHFVVDTDGTVYQTASLEKWTQHVGKPKDKDQKMRSSNTIGIEVVGNYKEDTKQWDPVSENQAMATADLVNTMIKMFGLDTSKIGNHEDLSRKTEGEGATVRNAINKCLDGCNSENR